MTTLNDQIDHLTTQVIDGNTGLDEALDALGDWLAARIDHLNEDELQAFRASLEADSTRDNRSLVDSVLKLHATRLLYRHRQDHAQPVTPPDEENDYTRARDRLYAALRQHERGLDDARIDIAIANAHHLLGNLDANRRWLQRALDRLPDLAALDVVTLAGEVPAMPLPKMGFFKRLGARFLRLDFSELAERNRANLVRLARMQTDQLAILAHLLGTSFETIRERRRSHRALRIAAHLVTRYNGLYLDDAEQLVEMAETLARPEPEAACILAEQALALLDPESDGALTERAEAVLAG